jgi:hypothetical protein
MKVTVNYIQGLASFLDELNITWQELESDQITFNVNSINDVFQIGYKFGIYFEQINRL